MRMTPQWYTDLGPKPKCGPKKIGPFLFRGYEAIMIPSTLHWLSVFGGRGRGRGHERGRGREHDIYFVIFF